MPLKPVRDGWEEHEINRIVDERTANPAPRIPIEEVMRETLDREE
ncbi:hypothetical protein GCM10010297_44260 [Streptomyces malachitofuscus]|nr:hypothetical protein GCM10010297_44260 [Streptomyces malachitofuscus]